MSITSYDGLLAGMQQPVFYSKVVTPTMVAGRPQSLWYLNGSPGAGIANATLNGVTYSSSSVIPNGAIYHVDPSGSQSAQLAKFLAALSSANPTVVWLCDRIWDNQIATSNTSLQSITTPTWPARDQNAQTNGLGIQLAIELSAAASSTAALISSCSYTNSAGASGQSATFLDLPTAAASQIGYLYRLQLANGDQGVRSVQGITFSTAWTSGTVHLVAYRPIAFALVQAAAIGNSLDPLSGGLPTIYNGVTPFIVLHPETTAAAMVTAFYQEVWG